MVGSACFCSYGTSWLVNSPRRSFGVRSIRLRSPSLEFQVDFFFWWGLKHLGHMKKGMEDYSAQIKNGDL